jgi:hypothetical protein
MVKITNQWIIHDRLTLLKEPGSTTARWLGCQLPRRDVNWKLISAHDEGLAKWMGNGQEKYPAS